MTLGLIDVAIDRVATPRIGLNGGHALIGLLRQSVFGRQLER
jgi:hypothetical protein